MNCDSFYDELCKIAAEKPKDLSLGTAAALGGGAVVAGKSAPALLGTKRVYHGTSSPEIAKKIRAEGLLRSAGGGGAAQIDPGYISKSKDFVHITPRKLIGRFFAGLPQEFTDRPTQVREAQRNLRKDYVVGEGFTERAKARSVLRKWRAEHKLRRERPAFQEAVKRMLNPFSRGVSGRMLAADIPMHLWEKFEADPDMTPLRGGAGKEMAAKGKADIAARYIHGGKGNRGLGLMKERLKYLPEYIRRYPGRFGRGALMLAGGAGLMGYGGHKLRKQYSDS